MITKMLGKIIMLSMLIMMFSIPVALAEVQDRKAGILPDSPFYFVDKMFDRFQDSETLADEKLAEIEQMAVRNHTRGIERAREQYEKAITRRERKANDDEESAENVARQTSKHIAVLAKVLDQVPEQAKPSINRAINRSANGRGRALAALEESNRSRAGAVKEATEEEIIVEIPEQNKEMYRRKIQNREMEQKFEAHYNSLQESMKCGLIDEEIVIDENKFGNQTNFSAGEFIGFLEDLKKEADLNNDTEKMEYAKDLADEVSNKYGRGFGYWKNNDGCPFEDEVDKENGIGIQKQEQRNIGEKERNISRPNRSNNEGKANISNAGQKERGNGNVR